MFLATALRAAAVPRYLGDSSKAIFVAALPWTAGKRELRDYFARFGPVKRATVVYNRETGISRGYGFVHFESPQCCEAVMKEDRHIIDGKAVTVNPVLHENVNKTQDDATTPIANERRTRTTTSHIPSTIAAATDAAKAAALAEGIRKQTDDRLNMSTLDIGETAKAIADTRIDDRELDLKFDHNDLVSDDVEDQDDVESASTKPA